MEIFILLVTGVVGANAAGSLAKEYNLGAIKNTIVGAAAGGSGYFLQQFIPPTVDINGNPVLDHTAANHLMTAGLVGLGAGGILALALGFLIAEVIKIRSR